MLALQRIGQAGAADDFGIQALGGQEHHREVGAVRWHHVLVADRPGLGADGLLQLCAGAAHQLRITLLLGVEQALVVLARELGVDRQPYRHLVLAAAGQADGEIDHLVAVRPQLHPARVLAAGEHLLQDRLQLHLAPSATGLDVAQHALEVVHPGGQLLHLAQAALDLLQPLGHQLER